MNEEEWTDLDDLHSSDSDSTEIYNDQAQQSAEADFRKSETQEVVGDDIEKVMKRRSMRFDNVENPYSEPEGGNDERWDKFKL